MVAHSSQKTRLEWATQNIGRWCSELCHSSLNSPPRINHPLQPLHQNNKIIPSGGPFKPFLA